MIIEVGVCARLIGVPSVVPLIGNSWVWVTLLVELGCVVQVWVASAGEGRGSVHVTYAVADVGAVPVTVPLTRLLVTMTFVPLLQLFGRHDAEMPTTPGAIPFTDPVLPTPAIEGWVEFQLKLGRVVRVAPLVSFTVTIIARVAAVAISK